jgi:excisionase family DNA binding protein
MSSEKLLTIKEVAEILRISEGEVKKLSERGEIPAYKIGGVHLRFKEEQIEEIAKLRLALRPTEKQKILGTQPFLERVGFIEHLKDFFYFNDFYIISIIIILIILFIIFRT